MFIIPGVGHAGAAMEKLRASGLAECIHTIQKPVLGICVVLQEWLNLLVLLVEDAHIDDQVTDNRQTESERL